jgi:hypothetical protein
MASLIGNAGTVGGGRGLTGLGGVGLRRLPGPRLDAAMPVGVESAFRRDLLPAFLDRVLAAGPERTLAERDADLPG